MKLKRMPSLKERKRYLLFSIISDKGKIPYFEVKDSIWHSVLSWIGERGAANAHLRLIKNLWNDDSMEGVVQCSPKFVDDVKMALALIRNIGDAKTIFSVRKVSGTIKSLRKSSSR